AAVLCGVLIGACLVNSQAETVQVKPNWQDRWRLDLTQCEAQNKKAFMLKGKPTTRRIGDMITVLADSVYGGMTEDIQKETRAQTKKRKPAPEAGKKLSKK
ncbi:unnamed protein product, partial [Polarella glacialis]